MNQGIFLNMDSMRDYIAYLTKYKNDITQKQNDIENKYKTISDWGDEKYQEIGMELQKTRKEIQVLATNLDITIKTLKDLVMKAENYLRYRR